MNKLIDLESLCDTEMSEALGGLGLGDLKKIIKKTTKLSSTFLADPYIGPDQKDDADLDTPL